MTAITPPMASFTELRDLADASLVARACIDLRCQEIAGIAWDIVPDHEPDRAIREGNRHLAGILTYRCDEARRFFHHPSLDYADFTDWLLALARESLTIDALAVHLRVPHEAGRGLLGGSIASLDILDGATIEPVPAPGAALAGYAQYSRPAERRSLREMMATPLAAPPQVLYGPDQVRYWRYADRAWTLHGRSPLEAAIVRSEDGGIDIPATEALLPGKFGLDPEAIGVSPPHASGMRDGELWIRNRLHWLASLLTSFLEGSGLRWKWEGLDG